MRNIRILAILVAALSSNLVTAFAQEVLSREEALKYAFLVAVHEPASLAAPIRVDADLKRPFAGHDGEYGALVLPETKLTAATIQAIGKDVVPIGQLWLRRLTPIVAGSPASASDLQMVSIQHEGESTRVPLCLLGARRTEAGTLELLVYGKGKEPLLRVPLAKATRTQTLPIELGGERQSDGGSVKVYLLGQYEAVLPVTELED